MAPGLLEKNPLAAVSTEDTALQPASASRRRWLALVVLCVGQLMIVLDVTVVNVALPVVQRDLRFSPASLAWVVNGYLIAFGGLLMLAGRLGDLLGRRRLFLGGLAVFTAASFLCGASGSQEMLIAARFLQGAGAAVIAAMVLGILVTLFPEPRERTLATSVYAFVASAGGSIGLLAGGVLTEALNWHWIFFINLPIGIGAGVLGTWLIPDQPGIGLRQRIDVLGAALITAGPALLVYTTLQAADQGWATQRTAVLGAGSAALLTAFVAVESRTADPLIPLRLFRSRTIAGANLVRALFAVGLFGIFFLGALYMQRVLGYSSVATGLAFLPNNLTVGVFSLFLTRRIVARFGAKATLVTGLLLVAAALGLFSRTPVNGSFVVDILPVMLLTGAGAGLIFMPSVNLAMADAGPRDSGILSGLTNVSLQLGAAVGVAVLASVSSSRTSALLREGATSGVALTSGYRLGLLIAMGCLLAAALTAGILFAPRTPARGLRVVARRAMPQWLWGGRTAVAADWE